MAVAKGPLEGGRERGREGEREGGREREGEGGREGGREREGEGGREGGREGEGEREAIILRGNAFTAHHSIHNHSKFTKLEHHPS